MKIELLIDNRKGTIYDISDLVSEVTWKTRRKGSASSLDVTFIESNILSEKGELLSDIFKVENGDVVSFKVDRNKVFFGYIFKHSGTKSKEVKITAYDQMRYLLFSDAKQFVNKKASDITKEIVTSVGLKIGEIEDTGYTIPTLLCDEKTLLDMIYSALEQTVLNNKQTYTLYDNFGAICLKNINNMKQTAVISDGSNLGDYDYENSIDSETYNRVKFVKDNKDTGGRDVYIAQDSNHISKWGRLQLFKKIDEKLNKAQISEMLDSTLKLKNREEKKLKLKDVIGIDVKVDIQLRAGAGVYVEISKRKIAQFYLIEEATHKFNKQQHMMDFDLKVV